MMLERNQSNDEWSKQRNLFTVLLHTYSRRQEDPLCGVSPAGVMRDLGLDPADATALLESLMESGFLARRDGSSSIVLTPAGRDYIEFDCGRRRSIRR